MIVLENEGFRVEINSFGAELTSFRSKTTGTEYVWGGDPAAWKRHAPVLFPIVGRLADCIQFIYGINRAFIRI